MRNKGLFAIIQLVKEIERAIMNKNICAKIFRKTNENGISHTLFLTIRADFKYYRITPYFDKWGDLVEHKEVLKDSLFAVDPLNNNHKSWRINGWKKAQKELENEGYQFIKDIPKECSFLTQSKHFKNLERFINDEPLQKLENLHPYVVGQEFTKPNHSGKALFRVSRVFHDAIVFDILSFPKKKRNGEPNGYHTDTFMHYRFKRLIDSNKIILIEKEEA